MRGHDMKSNLSRLHVTFPLEPGCTVIRQRMLLGLSTRCAFFTVPPVTWNAWSFRVL